MPRQAKGAFKGEFVLFPYSIAKSHKKIKYSIVYSVKLFTLKRSAAALAAAVAVLSALTGIVCGGMPYASAAAAPVIVIDAGHGGIDAGVRGKQSGVKESDINLAKLHVCRFCR